MIFASITDRCLNPGACTDAHTVNRQAHRLVQNGDHIAKKKKKNPWKPLCAAFGLLYSVINPPG